MAQVEQVVSSDRARTAAAVLGRAFAADPVWLWLLAGRSSPQRRLTGVFAAFAGSALRKQDARILLRSDGSAAALWLPPGGWRAPATDVLRSGPQLLRALGTGSVRSLRLLTAVERQHPAEPHWYLEALGVVPEAQGRGVGPGLLQPVLERCDHDGVPAYLESSNPRNVPFYARHGFLAGAPLAVPAGCPVITPMWRGPR